MTEEKRTNNLETINAAEKSLIKLKEELENFFGKENFRIHITCTTPDFELEIDNDTDEDSHCDCEKQQEHIKTQEEMSLAENFICWLLKENLAPDELDLNNICKVVATDPFMTFVMDYSIDKESNGLRQELSDWLSRFLQSLYEVDFTKLRKVTK